MIDYPRGRCRTWVSVVAERTIMRKAELPSLNLLGRDLLTVERWRLAVSLTTPFLLTTAFFLFAAYMVVEMHDAVRVSAAK